MMLRVPESARVTEQGLHPAQCDRNPMGDDHNRQRSVTYRDTVNRPGQGETLCTNGSNSDFHPQRSETL